MSTGLRTLVLALSLALVAALGAGAATAAATLDAAERDTLLAMREEEKVAHDVYVALAKATGVSAFLRIAASEERHGAAIERMLTLYGIADPTDGYAVGTFPSPDMQRLYDDLVARGSVSRAAAIDVGLWIERHDVADLQAAIAETDEVPLDRVYGNLLAASQRHLQAFERNLAACAGDLAQGSGERTQQGRGGATASRGRAGQQLRSGTCASGV